MDRAKSATVWREVCSGVRGHRRTDLLLRNSGALARVTNLPGKEASKRETDNSCLLPFLQAKRVSFFREKGSFSIVFISLYGHLVDSFLCIFAFSVFLFFVFGKVSLY